MYRSDRFTSSLAFSLSAAWLIVCPNLIRENAARAESAPTPMAVMPDAGQGTTSELRTRIEPGDSTAALEAVEIALTQAGDGTTYVWRRGNGRIVGAVRPTKTFRDADRRICRHIEMRLQVGTYARRTEGIACRGTDGVWLLEG